MNDIEQLEDDVIRDLVASRPRRKGILTAVGRRKPLLEAWGSDLAAEAAIQRACERYLGDQPFSLFGDFDISREDRRRQASAWLALQAQGVMDEMTLRDLVAALYYSRLRNWRKAWGRNHSRLIRFGSALRHSVKSKWNELRSISPSSSPLTLPPPITSIKSRKRTGSGLDSPRSIP